MEATLGGDSLASGQESGFYVSFAAGLFPQEALWPRVVDQMNVCIACHLSPLSASTSLPSSVEHWAPPAGDRRFLKFLKPRLPEVESSGAV